MHRIAFAGAFLMLLVCAAAGAAPFASDELGFSADFPEAPAVQAPQDASHDADGNVLSRAVVVQAGRAHVYSAVVVVETFLKPHTLDIDKTLIANRDGCLQGYEGMTITASDPVLQDGHRALRFRYAGPHGHGGGAGIVAVVEGETPRIYVLFGMRTPKADPETVAAMERWVESFHIGPRP